MPVPRYAGSTNRSSRNSPVRPAKVLNGVVIEGDADWFVTGDLGQHDVGSRDVAEQQGPQVRFGDRDVLQVALILGEATDQPEDVGGRSGWRGAGWGWWS